MSTATDPVRALMQWRPHDPHEWAREVAGLNATARGALLSLADALWLSEVGGCGIAGDERSIAAAAGVRLEWTEDEQLRRAVLSVLEPHPEIEGLVTWPWLLTQWTAQRKRHLARRNAGAKGGRGRKRSADDAQRELEIADADEVTQGLALVEDEPAAEGPSEAVPEKHCLPMLSNARQSKRERTASLHSVEREAVLLSAHERPDESPGAPPAAGVDAARVAPVRLRPPDPQPQPQPQPRAAPDVSGVAARLAPPPLRLSPSSAFDREAQRRALALEEAEREEAEYYARKRQIVGAAPVSVAAVDWRAGLGPPLARTREASA